MSGDKIEQLRNQYEKEQQNNEDNPLLALICLIRAGWVIEDIQQVEPNLELIKVALDSFENDGHLAKLAVSCSEDSNDSTTDDDISWGDVVEEWLKEQAKEKSTPKEVHLGTWVCELDTTEIQTDQGLIETPVVHWMLKSSGMGLIGGDVYAVPQRSFLSFRDRRFKDFVYAQSPEEIIEILKEYGWDHIPHLYEVCQKMDLYKSLINTGIPSYQALETVIHELSQIEGIENTIGL